VVLWPTETEAVAPWDPDLVEAENPREPSESTNGRRKFTALNEYGKNRSLTTEGTLSRGAEGRGEESSKTSSDFL